MRQEQPGDPEAAQHISTAEGHAGLAAAAVEQQPGAAEADRDSLDDLEPEYDGPEDDEGIDDDEVHIRRSVYAVVGTLLSVAFLALLAGNVYQFVHNRNDQVVATVNGSRITEHDLARSGASSADDLKTLIDDKLVQQEASRQHVSVSEAEVNSQINDIKQRLSTQAEFTAALQRNNLTEAQLRNQIRSQSLKTKLGAKDVTISDAEVQDAFDKNKQQFGQQTFDQVKDPLKQQLLQQKQQQAVSTWLDALRQKAKIVNKLQG